MDVLCCAVLSRGGLAAGAGAQGGAPAAAACKSPNTHWTRGYGGSGGLHSKEARRAAAICNDLRGRQDAVHTPKLRCMDCTSHPWEADRWV